MQFFHVIGLLIAVFTVITAIVMLIGASRLLQKIETEKEERAE